MSSARAGNQEDGLWLPYPLFVRNQSQYSLTIHVTPEEFACEKITLIIADRYLQSVEITSISPTPSRVAESTDGLAYEFEIMDQETSPSIIFFMNPDVIASLHATVELVDGAPINFRQFVYPLRVIAGITTAHACCSIRKQY